MVQKISIREKPNETVSKPLPVSIDQQQRKRYTGVRQSPSGRWVAEIKGTAQKIRLWLGTFDTAEAAACAYDEAACLLRGAKTRTNFWPRKQSGFGSSSVLSTKVLNQLLQRLEAQRPVSKSSEYLFPPPQHHKHNQELEVVNRMAYSDDEIMKGAVNLGEMEDFSCFFAPFENGGRGRGRVEMGSYEYWSMFSADANGV